MRFFYFPQIAQIKYTDVFFICVNLRYLREIKTRRRNSTDPEDLFYAHISGMDAFARALLIADNILEKSAYKKLRTARYASFDKGEAKEFENGKLSFEYLRNYALGHGEPPVHSGKQELYELIINTFM